MGDWLSKKFAKWEKNNLYFTFHNNSRVCMFVWLGSEGLLRNVAILMFYNVSIKLTFTTLFFCNYTFQIIQHLFQPFVSLFKKELQMLTLYHCSNWQEVDLFLRDFRRCIPVVWELLAYTDASFWSLREGRWDNTLNHSRPCSKHLPAKLFGGE